MKETTARRARSVVYQAGWQGRPASQLTWCKVWIVGQVNKFAVLSRGFNCISLRIYSEHFVCVCVCICYLSIFAKMLDHMLCVTVYEFMWTILRMLVLIPLPSIIIYYLSVWFYPNLPSWLRSPVSLPPYGTLLSLIVTSRHLAAALPTSQPNRAREFSSASQWYAGR